MTETDEHFRQKLKTKSLTDSLTKHSMNYQKLRRRRAKNEQNSGIRKSLIYCQS